MGVFVGVTNLKFKLLHLISMILSVFNRHHRYILNQHLIQFIDDIRKHIFNKLTYLYYDYK